MSGFRCGNASWSERHHIFPSSFDGAATQKSLSISSSSKGQPMHITSSHIMPIAALAAGLIVLLLPRILSFVVGAYLIIVGLIGLNGIYHLIK
jgi:hypothetical protein